MLETFRVAGTPFYKNNIMKVAEQISAGIFYRGMTDHEIISYLENSSPVRWLYKYPVIDTDEVMLKPEPTNQHDKNAIQVLVNGVLIGYVPSDMAVQIGQHIKTNPNYSAIVKIYGGPYKTYNFSKIVKGYTEFKADLMLEMDAEIHSDLDNVTVSKIPIVRTVFGVMFLLASFKLIFEGNFTSFLVGLVIALLLLQPAINYFRKYEKG